MNIPVNAGGADPSLPEESVGQAIRIGLPPLIWVIAFFLIAVLFKRRTDAWWTVTLVSLALAAVAHLSMAGWAYLAHGAEWGYKVLRYGWKGLIDLSDAIKHGQARNRQPPTWIAAALGLALIVYTGMAFWDSVSPDSSRQSVQANSNEVPTVEPGEGATYDPEQIGNALASGNILPEEMPFRGDCDFSNFEDTDGFGEVGAVEQACEHGVIQYWVYETDADALEYVLWDRTGSAPVLTRYAQYQTDVYTTEDEVVVFIVAVGNVVVEGFTPQGYEDVSASEYEDMNTPRYASNLAEIGIDRLLRIAGYAP